MGTTNRFRRDEVERILELTPKQLDYWDRLRLVSARKEHGDRFYDFSDLIGLRTVKQLTEKGVPANRLGRALAALREKLSQVQAPLTELRVLSDGRNVVIERDGTWLEPLSGQFVMNFETRELDARVRVMSARTTEEWFGLALAREADKQLWPEAIDAYNRALSMEPNKLEALINCGTLYYEHGNLQKASEYFQRAIDTAPQNALAHSNLGSVLDELGQLEEARQHLRQAIQLDPGHADARYNLALVCEKLGAYPEAQEHWRSYVRLHPVGSCSDYARQRLASAKAAGSAR